MHAHTCTTPTRAHAHVREPEPEPERHQSLIPRPRPRPRPHPHPRPRPRPHPRPHQSLISAAYGFKGGLLGQRISELYVALQPRRASRRARWAASSEAERVVVVEKARRELKERVEEMERERKAKEAQEIALYKQNKEREAAGLEPLPRPHDPMDDFDWW